MEFEKLKRIRTLSMVRLVFCLSHRLTGAFQSSLFVSRRLCLKLLLRQSTVVEEYMCFDGKLHLYVVCRLVSQQTSETCVGMKRQIISPSFLAHIFLALMTRGWSL